MLGKDAVSTPEAAAFHDWRDLLHRRGCRAEAGMQGALEPLERWTLLVRGSHVYYV